MTNIEELSQIFENNKDKRICVLGTTCTGKTTLINELETGLDMDELVKTKLSIKPGIPMFGTVLIDCDLIVYLHISDELLEERTKSRNVDFEDAKNMQMKIEDEIDKSTIETIKLEVVNKKKNLKR